MQISVLPCDWGEARLCDIEALLKDTASHLTRELRNPFNGIVNVKTAPPNNRKPRIHFRSAPDDPFVIQLTAQNRRWSQFSYQFAHEFCHALSGYQQLRNNPNNWFHEAICELASVFSLRRMVERWPTHPPFPNWSGYTKSLEEYVVDLLSRGSVQLPIDISLHDWLSSNEEQLRRGDPYQRDKNALVAYALLPIFECCPSGWNTITKFPSSSARMAEYLAEWHSLVDTVDKPFVERLTRVLCQ